MAGEDQPKDQVAADGEAFDAAFDGPDEEEGAKPEEQDEQEEQDDELDTPDTGAEQNDDLPPDDDEPDKPGEGGDQRGQEGDEKDPSGREAGGDDSDDWKDRAIKAEARMASWEGRLSATARENQELKDRIAELEKSSRSGQGSGDGDSGGEDGSPAPSDQQVTEAEGDLAEFYDDFPQLKRPLELLMSRVKAEAKAEAEAAMGEHLKPLQEREQRARQADAEAAQEAHVKAITEAHEDWEQIAQSGALNEWIEKQPAFLAETYQRVMQEGSTEEVIDLFSAFKDATGHQQQQQQTSNRRSRQAIDGEAVPRRSGRAPTGRAGKDDFDSAFDEAPD